MKSCAMRAIGLTALGLALTLVPQSGLGQATVTHDEGRVVVEGGYVRIESPEGVTEVTDDWRSGTSVRFTDTDALLTELGAVQGDDYIRLRLAGDVLFDLGSAVINQAAAEVLAQVAQVIRDRTMGEVLVVGHTDSLGDDASNQRLSEARAVAVIRWLQDEAGIPAALLVGRGMGERQPVAHNTTPDGRDDPAGRARNRRVELFVGTSEHADVRAAADRVTVQTAEGEVRIEEDRVEVGDVQIDSTGVRVGGVAVGGAQGTGDRNVNCAAGRRCTAGCPQGDCVMTCSAGAHCDFTCQGGNCRMLCSAGATCKLNCPGGGCRFSCALGSSCSTSCAGGGCSGG